MLLRLAAAVLALTALLALDVASAGEREAPPSRPVASPTPTLVTCGTGLGFPPAVLEAPGRRLAVVQDDRAQVLAGRGRALRYDDLRLEDGEWRWVGSPPARPASWSSCGRTAARPAATPAGASCRRSCTTAGAR